MYWSENLLKIFIRRKCNSEYKNCICQKSDLYVNKFSMKKNKKIKKQQQKK